MFDLAIAVLAGVILSSLVFSGKMLNALELVNLLMNTA